MSLFALPAAGVVVSRCPRAGRRRTDPQQLLLLLILCFATRFFKHLERITSAD